MDVCFKIEQILKKKETKCRLKNHQILYEMNS